MTKSSYIPSIKRELKILYIPNGEYIVPNFPFAHFGLSHWHVIAYRKKVINKFVKLCSELSTWGRPPEWFGDLPRNHTFDISEFEFIFIVEGIEIND